MVDFDGGNMVVVVVDEPGVEMVLEVWVVWVVD